MVPRAAALVSWTDGSVKFLLRVTFLKELSERRERCTLITLSLVGSDRSSGRSSIPAGGLMSSSSDPRSMIGLCIEDNEMTLIWLASVAVSDRRRLRGKPDSKKGRHDRLSFSTGRGADIVLGTLFAASLVSLDMGRDNISLNVWDR